MFKWRENNPITRTIQDQEVEFIRIPIGTFQKMRGLKKEVAKAASFLMSGNNKSTKINQTTVPFETSKGELKQDADGNTISTTDYTEDPISPALATQKAKERQEAIEALMDILTDDKGMDILSEIVVRSAHREFAESDIPLLKREMDPLTMFQFLMGALEASGGEYAKLGKSWFLNNTKVQDLAQGVKEAQE